MTDKPAVALHALIHLARSHQNLFQQCVDLALTTTRATTAVITIHRQETDDLRIAAAAGHLSEDLVGRTFARGEALAWRVVTGQRMILISDPQFQSDAHFASGHRRPGAYLGVPLVDPDGRVFGALSVDTTDSAEQLGGIDAEALTLLAQATGVAHARLEALERAEETADQFEQLAALSADLEALNDPVEIANQALEILVKITRMQVGAVYEITSHGSPMLTLAVWADRERAQNVLSELRSLPGTMLAELSSSSEPVVLTGTFPQREAHFQETHWSAVGAPLRPQGHMSGMIGVLRIGVEQKAPTEVIRLVEMVARRIDRAVERAALITDLRRMREAALRRMGRVLEYRDGETSGHTDRVTRMALHLGTLLELSDEQLDHLRWGAYLHDIGKVGVPDQVLLKPGPLTPQERERMQQHVLIGEELLEDEGFLPDEVRQVVRHHHERWDGAGYPDGLAGECIPLLARIFSVVDVYDALTSVRPYKQAWSHEAAMVELVAQAGRQFDPQIVRLFAASGLVDDHRYEID
ncbi:GAF and HD-GYP domain-containing protein [Deinococcus altitudinis]|uniref:GAF and HD-GYP domain-containing protein n=1 Tax=Deinococcus altitudinis TaxID=468914 RepID=UPI00389245D1